MDGFSVDLSSNIVPDIQRAVNMQLAHKSSLSPIGRRVPGSLFDSRGSSFNPGAIAGLGQAQMLPDFVGHQSPLAQFVPDTAPRIHTTMIHSTDFQDELSPIGQRVPTRRFDTRGAGFNPGALAQFIPPALVLPEHPTAAITAPFKAPAPTSAPDSEDFVEEEEEMVAPPPPPPVPQGTFFRNPDGTLRTGRVAISLVGGGIAVGLLLRALA